MIRIDEIINDAEKAILANYRMRNVQAFVGMPERQTRLVMERKRQIREWVAVVRILRHPANHGPVLARVTDRGEHSGRNLMAHSLRNRVILGGLDAIIERAKDQQRNKAEQPRG